MVSPAFASKLPVDQALDQARRCQRVFLQLDFSIHDDRVRLEHDLARLSSTKHITEWEYMNKKLTHLLLSQNEISEVGQPILGWCREIRVIGPRTRSVSHALAYLQLTEKLPHDFTAILKHILAVNL